MHPTAAIPILQALADGLDPVTSQPYPPDSPYQRADTIRALHAALDALRAPAGPAAAKTPRPLDPDKPAAGQKWTPEEDQRLRDAYAADTPIADLAAAHGRTSGAIQSRLLKLGLITLDTPATHRPSPAPLPAEKPPRTPTPTHPHTSPLSPNPKPDDDFPF